MKKEESQKIVKEMINKWMSRFFVSCSFGFAKHNPLTFQCCACIYDTEKIYVHWSDSFRRCFPKPNEQEINKNLLIHLLKKGVSNVLIQNQNEEEVRQKMFYLNP